MTKSIINVGTSANSKTGDSLRTAFLKINANFDELYATSQVAFPIQTGQTGKFLTTNGSTLSWSVVPSTNQLVNNNHTISVNSSGQITVDGSVYYTIPEITVDHIPPANPVTGNLWFDTESGRLYVYFDTSWVDANPKGQTGSTIPNQNTNAGKFLTTDGSNLSWTTVYPLVSPPTHSTGASGDKAGMVAYDANYHYYCKANYTSGIDNIWVRVIWTETNW